jgi:hypothetical protein
MGNIYDNIHETFTYIYDNIHELCLERNYFIYRQYLLTLMVLCREWLEPIGYSCNGGYRCQMETRFRQK